MHESSNGAFGNDATRNSGKCSQGEPFCFPLSLLTLEGVNEIDFELYGAEYWI